MHLKAAASLAAAAAASLPLVLADLVYHDSQAFASGSLGQVPSQNFTSRPSLSAPVFNIKVNNGSLDPGYYMFGWAGAAVERPSPIIFDSNGTIVWISEIPYQTSDFDVQMYQGENYLTVYNGTFAGNGAGDYRLLNSSYDIVKIVDFQFEGSTTRLSDIHEFRITSNDTFIITSWGYPVEADLTSVGGPQDGWTYNCMVQELDSDNNVLFNWTTLDAGIPVSETMFPAAGSAGTYETPYDYCHQNSVEKDDDGSYLISLRGPSALYKVDMVSKEVVWRLGGKNTSFQMGEGTTFKYQHDARWLNDSSVNPRYLSLFDNDGLETEPDVPGVGRGLVLAVDSEAMTVELVLEMNSTSGLPALAQGSTQGLNSTNYLVGYGFQPHISEFSSTGELLYDAWFGPDSGQNVSLVAYRVYNRDWEGHPRSVPAVGFQGENIFVSWNGATEVRSWGLATGNDSSSLSLSSTFGRTGFETNSTYDSSSTYIAAVAQDASGACMAVSAIYSTANTSQTGIEGSCSAISGVQAAIASTDGQDNSSSASSVAASVVLTLLGVVGAACLL